jgi:hypothetical protein
MTNHHDIKEISCAQAVPDISKNLHGNGVDLLLLRINFEACNIRFGW